MRFSYLLQKSQARVVARAIRSVAHIDLTDVLDQADGDYCMALVRFGDLDQLN
jgi:hypothetical protein